MYILEVINIQIRKLVKSGAASHTLALPSDWIKKNKLKKGDLLYIVEKNNELRISTEEKAPKKSNKEITIKIDDQEINTIRRKTISSYINNYSIFTFHGESLNKKLEDIRKILDNFLALEIIEQTTTKLVAKDFLNIQEFSLKNTIRRMDMLARSIITDAKQGKESAASLEFRDYEVDKLFFLISRLTRSNLEDPASSTPHIRSMSTWWMAKNLESIADAAKNLSKTFNEDIKDIYEEIESYYQECIKSYIKEDKELADKLINKRISLLKKTDNIKNENKHLLKSMINSSRNIAKIILDS